MQIYGNESNGNYPVVANAPTSEVPLDLLVPKFTADTATFVCPGSKDSALSSGESLRKGRISYSYYMGRKVADASEALLSDKQVDTKAKTAGQNAFSANGKAPGNNHHQYGGNFLFVDGHAETTPPSLPFSVALPSPVVLLNPKP
jgi:prepilin-type processing-associated H-X9-DG protein